MTTMTRGKGRSRSRSRNLSGPGAGNLKNGRLQQPCLLEAPFLTEKPDPDKVNDTPDSTNNINSNASDQYR